MLERALHVRLELQPAQRRLVHRGLEHLVAVLAPLLGHVHRDVGVAHQRLDVVDLGVVGLRDRDPDARPDEHLLVLEVERPVERLDQPLGDVGRADRIAAVLEQHRELVAAEARRGIGRPQDMPEPLADLAEQHVAGGVPERVVDRLEVVEVHEQDRHGSLVALLTLEGVRHAVAEQHTVPQSGQRVVERLVRQLLLERLALADVAGREDDAVDVRVVHQVRAQRLGQDHAPVAAPYPELEGRHGVVALAAGQERQRARLVLVVHQVDEAGALEIAARVAERAQRRRAHVGDRRVDLDDGDHVARVAHERGEPRLALLEQQLLRQGRALQGKGGLRRQRLDRACGGRRHRAGDRDHHHGVEGVPHQQRRDQHGAVRLGEPQLRAMNRLLGRQVVRLARLQPSTLGRFEVGVGDRRTDDVGAACGRDDAQPVFLEDQEPRDGPLAGRRPRRLERGLEDLLAARGRDERRPGLTQRALAQRRLRLLAHQPAHADDREDEQHDRGAQDDGEIALLSARLPRPPGSRARADTPRRGTPIERC